MSSNNNNNKFNLADLLRLADEQATATADRKPNTARLYASGRINIAGGSDIVADERRTAKIADATLILYRDATAKRKTNRKTNSTDVLYNLTAELRNRSAYAQAVQDSKVDGNKGFRDYTIAAQELDGVDYYIIDLTEHAND